MFCVPNVSQANSLNAGAILNDMDAKQRYGYVSGVVEGLAYSRFLRDKPSETGMKCIYDWYYKDGVKQWARIESWFGRHPDKPAGVLLYVLIKKDCGA